MGTPRVSSKYVDGKTNDLEIAQCVAISFEKACTSNSEIKNKKLHSSYCSMKVKYNLQAQAHITPSITVELVDRCIEKLKLGRSASIDNITAEHHKYSHPIIVQILCKLFEAMLIYEYIPNGFGISMIVQNAKK